MRYFFDVILEGELIPDQDGTDLESPEAAQEEAQAIARELRAEFPERVEYGSVLEVRDAGGARIFALCLGPQAIAA